ncbi:MAG: translation elongation factor Ts [Bacilli bacterium]|nr:translation elongation factor Ts [Bacilli bacterium]MDD4809009.1 translation elongation factor Ts [Bacilli bacterium]
MISAGLVKELREKTGAGMLDCKKALEENNGDIEAAIDWLREKGISKAAKKADRIAAEGIAAILIKDNDAVIVEVNAETDFVSKNDEFKEMVNTILETIIENNPKTEEEVLNLNTSAGTIEELIVAKTSKIGEKLSFRRFTKLTKKDNEAFGSYIHMGGKIAVLTLLENTNEDVAKDVAMQAAAMRPTYVRISDIPSEVIERERFVLKEQIVNEGTKPEFADRAVEGRVKKFYKEVCLEEQPFIKDSDINVAKYVSNNSGTIKEMIRYEVGEGMQKREENFAEEVAKQINS